MGLEHEPGPIVRAKLQVKPVKPFSHAAACNNISLDARAPEHTRLSAHRDRYAKKNAAPDRRAHETSLDSRPETQNRMGPIRRPALASNCRRPLLFTRTACCFTYLFCWCSFVCQKTPDLSSDLPCRPCCFFVLLLVSRLAANPVHPGAPINRNPGPTRTARRNLQ